MEDGWAVWSPKTAGPVVFSDALNNSKALDKDMFDKLRHRTRINVAFIDGHIEAMNITSQDLSRVYILPPP